MAGRRLFPIAACGLMLATVALVGMANAERMPVRRYTTADGLAGDYIVRIYRDSRGFMWISTRDGLSRFDGVRFTTYGIRAGLPSATINRVLEARAGVYWIGTNVGACTGSILWAAAPQVTTRGSSGRSVLGRADTC